MGKRRINETCIAVSPTRLSRLLCNYCTACGDDAVERKHPKLCPVCSASSPSCVSSVSVFLPVASKK